MKIEKWEDGKKNKEGKYFIFIILLYEIDEGDGQWLEWKKFNGCLYVFYWD